MVWVGWLVVQLHITHTHKLPGHGGLQRKGESENMHVASLNKYFIVSENKYIFLR